MESYGVQIITGRMVESNEYRDPKTISGIGTGGSAAVIENQEKDVSLVDLNYND